VPFIPPEPRKRIHLLPRTVLSRLSPSVSSDLGRLSTSTPHHALNAANFAIMGLFEKIQASMSILSLQPPHLTLRQSVGPLPLPQQPSLLQFPSLLTHPTELELYRLEQRYTRREKRTTFISEAQYVDGEYIYASSPTSTKSSSTNDSTASRVSRRMSKGPMVGIKELSRMGTGRAVR
jgi:hypothetical protein